MPRNPKRKPFLNARSSAQINSNAKPSALNKSNHPHTTINPARYGVSFSVKQCRAFGVDPTKTLQWLLQQGWRRFRLMSYWNEHENVQGTYDFASLDAQLEQIGKAGGEVTLCLGARQPRWPENHWPEWAWQAARPERTAALLNYLETVVQRYKNTACIVSYQLENEALLHSFGRRPEVDRARLRAEYALVKRLDPSRPVIMTTSTSWGIPLRQPVPDTVGFSFYQVLYSSSRHRYTTAFHNPVLDIARAGLIALVWHRPSFIHELQCEPWGPKAIWEMTTAEQDESMSPAHIARNLHLAQQTRLYPIDLWGGEWWYWRQLQGDTSVYQAVVAALAKR